MELKDLLNTNLIQFEFEAKDKNDTISKLVDFLYEQGSLSDKKIYLEDVFAREKECSTGIGMGIAIPHARSKGVKTTSFTLIKLKNELEWESLDDQPVKFVIMLAVPAGENNEFLKLLATLSTNLMNDDFRDGLLNANTKDELVNVFYEKVEEI